MWWILFIFLFYLLYAWFISNQALKLFSLHISKCSTEAGWGYQISQLKTNDVFEPPWLVEIIKMLLANPLIRVGNAKKQLRSLTPTRELSALVCSISCVQPWPFLMGGKGWESRLFLIVHTKTKKVSLHPHGK